jgi:hypothetical protein
MPDDVESSQPQMLHVDANSEHPPRHDGRPATAPQITVQVTGLEPEHVRVVERRTNSDEPAGFIAMQRASRSERPGPDALRREPSADARRIVISTEAIEQVGENLVAGVQPADVGLRRCAEQLFVGGDGFGRGR